MFFCDTHALTQCANAWDDIFQCDALQDSWRSIHCAQTRRHTRHIHAGQQKKFNSRYTLCNHIIGQKSLSFTCCAQKQNKHEIQYSPVNNNSLSEFRLMCLKWVSSTTRWEFSFFYTYDVPNAASVPFGMSVDGARKSPLILMPDKTPVTVGKNTPNTRNHV